MRCRRRSSNCHCSCWSPPGEPPANMGIPSRWTIVGVSVVRGRRPGARDDARPSSSQNICSRLPSAKPSSGMVGELCSHPPLGVADIIFPQRSTTSTWQVSPRMPPSACTVGSPVVASSRCLFCRARSIKYAAIRGSRPSGLPGRTSPEALSSTSAARSLAYSAESSVSSGTF